jgi:hypothetical protein
LQGPVVEPEVVTRAGVKEATRVVAERFKRQPEDV